MEVHAMDPNIGVILIVVIFALIVLALLYVFREKVNITIKTILGSLHVTGSNPAPRVQRGAHVDRVTTTGGITSRDLSGISATVADSDAQGEIIAEVGPPIPGKKGPKA
jgi:hypothetical protein